MAPAKKRLLILLGAAVLLAVLYGPGALRWAELKAREHQLRSEALALVRENQRLYREMQRLRNDPSYAEEVARQELGFVRHGETVVQFQSADD